MFLEDLNKKEENYIDCFQWKKVIVIQGRNLGYS